MKKNRLSLITLILSTALMIACSGKTSSSSNNASSGSNSVSSSGSTALNSSSDSVSSTSASSSNGPGSTISSLLPSSSSAFNGNDGSLSSSSNSSSNSSISSIDSSSSNDSEPSSSSSEAPNLSSSEISSSIDSSSTSSDPIIVIDNSLDGQIAQFLNGLDITIPSLNEYNLSFRTIYYYSYEQYIIVAQGDDLDGAVEKAYLNKMNASEDLISQNDDEWYPVEEYGYLFADENEEISINFFTEEGYFFFTLSRNDGDYGELDVSEVDTSWYVDYVNFQGFEIVNSLPVNDIKESLELDPSTEIPALNGSQFIVAFAGESYDEDGYYYPATFYVLFEGDQVSSLVNLLKLAGFEAEVEEKIGYTIDLETWEEVEYTYYVGTAYDTDKNVYISIYVDSLENTIIEIYNFADLFTDSKTTNTDWTDEEKALMNETLGQVLPFMQFGSDYELYDDSDDNWDLLVLEDTYFEDLSDDYVDLLIKAGFVEYDDPVYGLIYKYDNGLAYLEIFVYYQGGNILEIYFEESKIPAVTSITLNETTLDIAKGAFFQLEASLTPSDGNPNLVWSSNNEDVATVSDNGLVTINENAAVESSAVITVTALSGVSASCTFTVKADEVTAIKFAQDNYNVIPGGDKVQTSYFTLPVGATYLGTISYSISESGEEAGIFIDNDGKVWADASTAIGATGTITVSFNGTIVGNATVTVVSATVTDTLTYEFFGIKKGLSEYKTYNQTAESGATYQAQAAASTGLQLRSKNSNSGVIGHLEGKTCQSITFTFDPETEAPNNDRGIEIYASNSAFAITDMYGSKVTKVGTIVFDKNNLTQTYTFTSDYSYIGFRSASGAVYLTSVEVVWH